MQDQHVCWIQGRTGLLHIQAKQTDSLKKTNKLQKKVDRIEESIEAFFRDLADRIQNIEGLDLTDKGDDVVGCGLCMLAPPSTASSSSSSQASSDSDDDSDFNCSEDVDDDDDDEEDEEMEEEEEEEDNEKKQESCSSSSQGSDHEETMEAEQDPQ